GLTTIVENRPGAGTAIATEAVARLPADGNTLLLVNQPIIINPHLRKQNYDALTSFDPVCALVTVPTFLAVNAASPYHTLADFVSAARAKPGDLTTAIFVATASHIGFEMFKRASSINLTAVPYAGSGPAVTALLGGHITSLFDNYATVAEHV